MDRPEKTHFEHNHVLNKSKTLIWRYFLTNTIRSTLHPKTYLRFQFYCIQTFCTLQIILLSPQSSEHVPFKNAISFNILKCHQTLPVSLIKYIYNAIKYQSAQ